MGAIVIRRLQSAESTHLLLRQSGSRRSAGRVAVSLHVASMGAGEERNRDGVRGARSGTPNQDYRYACLRRVFGQFDRASNHVRGGHALDDLKQVAGALPRSGSVVFWTKVTGRRRVEPRRASQPASGSDNSARESVTLGFAHPAERRGGFRPLRTCLVRTLGQRATLEAAMG